MYIPLVYAVVPFHVMIPTLIGSQMLVDIFTSFHRRPPYAVSEGLTASLSLLPCGRSYDNRRRMTSDLLKALPVKANHTTGPWLSVSTVISTVCLARLRETEECRVSVLNFVRYPLLMFLPSFPFNTRLRKYTFTVTLKMMAAIPLD